MGQSITCNCLENMELDPSSRGKAASERLDVLKKGNKFTRNALLGITSQELFIALNEETSALTWKTVNNKWTKESNGEVDLTSSVKTVRLHGETGLQIIGIDDSTIFEVKAESPVIRDQWVVTINELLQFWIEHPDSKPKSTTTAAKVSNKAEYFKQREEEIAAREKVNAERKAKYSAGGMKYTAQIMANRA
eukprot:gene24154-32571_t